MITFIAAALSLNVWFADSESKVYQYSSGNPPKVVGGPSKGYLLALAANGTWAANDSGRLVIGLGKRVRSTHRLDCQLASFDGSGTRLAVVQSVGEKFRVNVIQGGKLKLQKTLTYCPGWLLWVGSKLAIPEADGSLRRAMGPVPAGVKAVRAAISPDETVSALGTGSPVEFKLVVTSRRGSKTYSAGSSRDLAFVAVDRNVAYYAHVVRDSDGGGNGTLVTPLGAIDLKTGKTSELSIPGAGYVGLLTPKG